MAFKTSGEAIGFLSQFIKDSPLSNSSANSVQTDEIHIITELFREEISDYEQLDGLAPMDDDIIMIRRIRSSTSDDKIWLVAPFEGGNDHLQRSGVVYRTLTNIGNFRIFRFPQKWQNPDDFWKGVHEGFGDMNERYFRLEPKNTNPRTLNYSRRGFQ
tara:strand:+ start:7763 stop:8236 length:474 start_codon:yes stop_codon:yes gene_type:complete